MFAEQAEECYEGDWCCYQEEGGCSEGGGELVKRKAHAVGRRQRRKVVRKGMFLLNMERGRGEDSVGKWTGSVSLCHICRKGPMGLMYITENTW